MSALSHSFVPIHAHIPVGYPDCTECDDAGRMGVRYCDCAAGEDARECDRGELSAAWIDRHQHCCDYNAIALEHWLGRFTDAEFA